MIKGNTKKYEIWTGNFSLGQGYHGGESPEKVGEEEGSRNYSDGRYVAEMIATIEGVEAFSSQEERLVKIAFK